MVLDDRNLAYFGLEFGYLGKNDPIRKRNSAPIREGAEPYSGNVFYYWFQFLKLHQEFVGAPKKGPAVRIVRSVYDKFDVGPYDDFYVWWRERGRHLFGGSGEDSPKAEGHLTAEEFAEKTDGIGIHFPFEGDIEAMLIQAEKMFRAARAAFYERNPSRKPSYELNGKGHKLVSLHNKLVIYRAVMSAPVDKPFWQIFDDVSEQLDLSTIDKRRKPKLGEDTHTDPISAASLTPDQITKWMADNFEQACRLVYHVARGEFPQFKKIEGNYNPRKVATRGY